MRRIGLVVLCLLVAGAAGGTTVASAHHHHAQRHRACLKHLRHFRHLGHHGRLEQRKRFRRCLRKQHGVGQTSGDREPSSGEQPKVLPPLPELIAPETECPGQSDETLSLESQEATMGCMINYARSKAGDAGLADVTLLNDSSESKASDIIQCNEFSHTACGRAFTYWLEQDGYLQPGACQEAGENIAWGTGELGTVRSILTAWINSPDHLENLLSASYSQLGVGMEVGTLSGYPEAHVWVTHFGSHC